MTNAGLSRNNYCFSKLLKQTLDVRLKILKVCLWVFFIFYTLMRELKYLTYFLYQWRDSIVVLYFIIAWKN